MKLVVAFVLVFFVASAVCQIEAVDDVDTSAVDETVAPVKKSEAVTKKANNNTEELGDKDKDKENVPLENTLEEVGKKGKSPEKDVGAVQQDVGEAQPLGFWDELEQEWGEFWGVDDDEDDEDDDDDDDSKKGLGILGLG